VGSEAKGGGGEAVRTKPAHVVGTPSAPCFALCNPLDAHVQEKRKTANFQNKFMKIIITPHFLKKLRCSGGKKRRT